MAVITCQAENDSMPMLDYMSLHSWCCTPHVNHTDELGLTSPCPYIPAMNALQKGRHAYIDKNIRTLSHCPVQRWMSQRQRNASCPRCIYVCHKKIEL